MRRTASSLLLDAGRCGADAAAIGFELGFTGAAGADAAAELRHGLAASGEAREQVLELGELDLELAFAGAGVAGKDVEDELRAVDDAARETRFEVAKLRGREVVIEEDEVGFGGARGSGDLVDLAAADQGCGVGARAVLHEHGGYLGFGGARELLKLGQRKIEFEVA